MRNIRDNKTVNKQFSDRNNPASDSIKVETEAQDPGFRFLDLRETAEPKSENGWLDLACFDKGLIEQITKQSTASSSSARRTRSRPPPDRVHDRLTATVTADRRQTWNGGPACLCCARDSKQTRVPNRAQMCINCLYPTNLRHHDDDDGPLLTAPPQRLLQLGSKRLRAHT